MAAEERDMSGVALVTGGACGIGFEVGRQPSSGGGSHGGRLPW